MKGRIVTYDDMESAVRRTKSARWLNVIQDDRRSSECSLATTFLGAPGIEFKSTGFRVQLRPDLPGIPVL